MLEKIYKNVNFQIKAVNKINWTHVSLGVSKVIETHMSDWIEYSENKL